MPGRWKAGRASTGFGWRTARAGSMRGEIRDRAMKAAAEAGVGTGSIRRLRAFSGEDRGRRVLEGRGDAPGLVHILSAMERCTSFRHWRDPKTGATTPRTTSGKCPHHYLGCSSTLGRLWFPHAMLCERRALERPGKPACGASGWFIRSSHNAPSPQSAGGKRHRQQIETHPAVRHKVFTILRRMKM